MSDRIARINLTALRSNYQKIKALTPHSRVLAMVKSNGYGHGLVRVARALDEADAFGVSIVDEAAELRESGITQKIVIMTGVVTSAELLLAEQLQVDLVIHCKEQIHLLEKTPCQQPLNIWLKLDTGMHRLGFAETEIHSAYQRVLACGWVKSPITLMTHLSNADDIKDPVTQHQLTVFKKVQAALKCQGSVANSGGILGWPESHYQWVRPGIMLYGISPLRGRVGLDETLEPVMTLSSRLIAIKQCQAGDRISYRGNWTCPEAMSVGVVACGYGDGYPLHAKSGTPVLVNGVSCPIVGRVCMDMLMVDLRPLSIPANIGDEVILWGEGLPVEVIAECAESIAYELITQLSMRVGFIV